jgi:hypothetical protein
MLALPRPLNPTPVLIGKLDYLVYSTAHSAGIVPWDGMPEPSSLDPENESASLRISCGLLRGPSSVWSVNLLRRKRRMKAYRGLRQKGEQKGERGEEERRAAGREKDEAEAMADEGEEGEEA